MPPFRVPLTAVVSSKPLLLRLAQTLALMLAVASRSWGQSPPPNPPPAMKKVHWHQYVNKEFGFSLRYPDTYSPAYSDDICTDNNYRRYLLCLESRDDSDLKVVVTIIIAQPFQISPVHADIMPTRQKIGSHVFYCGMVGSMGVGYADSCIYNLRGKALEFQFDRPQGPDSTEDKTELVPKMLKTLRTF